jgi:hypothetical protein
LALLRCAGFLFWSLGLSGLAWRPAVARAFISNRLGCLGSLPIHRCTGFYFWSFGLAASLVLLRCTGGYFSSIQEAYQLSKCTGKPKEIHPLSNCTDGKKEKRSHCPRRPSVWRCAPQASEPESSLEEGCRETLIGLLRDRNKVPYSRR